MQAIHFDMKKSYFASLAFLAATHVAFASDSLITVALEQHNYQTGAATVAVEPNGYVTYASVENIPSVTSATLSINAGGATSIPLEDSNFYELQNSYATSGALTAAYPTNATYTFNITSSSPGSAPSGSTTITGPGGTFAGNLPVTPLFSFGGVSGTWSLQGNVGVFTFNPASVTSFTISLTAYNATNKGGYYGSYVDVSDVNNSYTEVDEAGEGPTSDATASTATTLTFTKDLAANGGDADPLTYGFVSGSSYYIEGGLFNVFNLDNTTLTNGAGIQQAFVFGQTTGFILQAIPEPSTYAQLVGGFAVIAACALRRRRAR